MARICKDLLPERGCSILAIDTWTGSAEHYDNDGVSFTKEVLLFLKSFLNVSAFQK
jgi:hypothetical protein